MKTYWQEVVDFINKKEIGDIITKEVNNLEVFSKSDIGLVRTQNQDDCRFGVISPSCVWAATSQMT